MKKKWDLRAIMLRAWKFWRKGGLTLGEALHRAWMAAKSAPVNTQRIADAKAAAGIVEETNTWAGWKAAGFEVIHGSKALFGADLVYASRGDAIEFLHSIRNQEEELETISAIISNGAFPSIVNLVLDLKIAKIESEFERWGTCNLGSEKTADGGRIVRGFEHELFLEYMIDTCH